MSGVEEFDHRAAGGWPRVSLIVSTLGARDDLPRMVAHLREGDYQGEIEVVVVDQSLDQRANRKAAPLAGGNISVVTCTSGLGVSIGRNQGLRHASGEILGFPDDDAWLAPNCLTRVVRLLSDPQLDGVSGRQVRPDGTDSMLRWLKEPTRVTRINWHRTSIASTMFLKRSVVERIGNFDEHIGTGSKGWIGAGEETDLLLRALSAGFRIDYDPDTLVYQGDPRDDLTPDFVAKMSRYGAGMGHLFRHHHLPAWLFGWIAGRKVAGACVCHLLNQEVARDAQVAFVRGMIAGVRRKPPQPARRPH